MIDVTEILVHWHAGRSQAEIADSLAVDRKTVRKYTGLPRVSRTVGPLKVGVQPEASLGAWLHHEGRSRRSSRTSCVVR